MLLGLVVAAVARLGNAARLEALAAVDRLVGARLEGDFRLLATARANRRVHLTRGAVATTATTVAAAAAPVGTAAAAAVAAAAPVGAATATV